MREAPRSGPLLWILGGVIKICGHAAIVGAKLLTDLEARSMKKFLDAEG